MIDSVDSRQRRAPGRRFSTLLLATAAIVVGAVAATAAPATAAPAAAAADPAAVTAEDAVHIGNKIGYGGTGLFQVWSTIPATGEPDLWAYCIEHDVSAKTNVDGHVGDAGSYLGSNYFTDPVIQGKVRWVLAHSYPALNLTDFGAAAGAPGISRNDAIEATQYAIWRYTDLTWDAAWNFETPDSATAYWHLVNGANASNGLPQSTVTASVTAPSAPQRAGTLVGPFVVHTDQSTVGVSVTPSVSFTDADGDSIDADAVVDGQALYLDLRGANSAGDATVTVTATGSGATGNVISVPKTAGTTPTAGDHAQSLILVAPSTATTTATATTQWSVQAPAGVPSIGTSLVDAADGDRVLPASGGTVIDTVRYQNLTPGVGYTVSGELIRKSNGAGTGIIGSTAFVPTEANGSIEVRFVVPAGYAGQSLVAFERLFVNDQEGGGDPVAVHEDITDAAQTVTVQQQAGAPVAPGANAPQGSASTPKALATTGSAPVATIVPIAFLILAAGAALTLVRRRA
ncbi:VaFE repeat-containing surface-anchored protein [Plantibacter sp. Mn2098]|uniref:VaFE repeat-containing surface-anchored protein n=1 Tax=Plantibacter sp. Mn2098 TaxID=3395266 RepID=UPI003BD32E24